MTLLDGVQSDDSVAYGDSRIDYSSPKEVSSSAALIAGVGSAVTGLLVVSTLLVVSLLRWWNRRSVTNTRQNRQNQDLLADDSDVRYLRDEDDVHLDLTEATPQPKFFPDFQQL